MTTKMPGERYASGELAIDVGERRVTRAGERLVLAPKAYDMLVHLVRHAGRLVTKREMLDEVWSGAFVEEGILSVHVSALRKALGDDSRTPRFIETVSRTGYRFIAPVEALTEGHPTRRPGGVFGNWADLAEHFRKSATDPAVYEQVGIGRTHLAAASMHEVSKAVAAFEAAIALDATFAPAHAGLALACCQLAEFRQSPPADAYARAKAAALRALALDDVCADAQVALGAVSFLGHWDWVGAERSLQRALEINPNHADAYVLYGRLLEVLGRLDEGFDMKSRALERHPLSPIVHLAIAMSCWYQRRFEDSIVWANKTLALDPRHLAAREHLAGAYWAMHDFDRHFAEGLKHAEAYGVSADALQPMKDVYAAGGWPGLVRHVLTTQGANVADLQGALFHGELGELDAAFWHLNRAIDSHDPCLVDLAVAPQWDRLREDRRFDVCLESMNLRRSGAPGAPLRPA